MFIDQRATRRRTPPAVQCPDGGITYHPDGVSSRRRIPSINMQLLAELGTTGTAKSASNEL